MIEIIKEFRTKNFHVVLLTEEESDVDLSFDEDGSIRKGLENGSLVVFCAHAVVYCNGEEVGEDYLGNCIYKSIDEFWDLKEVGEQNRRYERKEKRRKVKAGSLGRCGSYAHDMISAAIEEARKRVVNLQPIHIRQKVGG